MLHKPFSALLIDHDDSFTQNLKWWLSQKFSTEIISSPQLAAFSSAQKFDLIVFSAGPKSPKDYSHSLNWLATNSTTPTLGICLGLQMMTLAEHGIVSPYQPVRHGKTSQLVFKNEKIKESFPVARYHSLECLPIKAFQTIAVSNDDQKLMWAEHQSKPWMGWQFHPESFLTQDQGFLINYLENWVRR